MTILLRNPEVQFSRIAAPIILTSYDFFLFPCTVDFHTDIEHRWQAEEPYTYHDNGSIFLLKPGTVQSPTP